jgi:hypothetical protein
VGIGSSPKDPRTLGISSCLLILFTVHPPRPSSAKPLIRPSATGDCVRTLLACLGRVLEGPRTLAESFCSSVVSASDPLAVSLIRRPHPGGCVAAMPNTWAALLGSPNDPEGLPEAFCASGTRPRRVVSIVNGPWCLPPRESLTWPCVPGECIMTFSDGSWGLSEVPWAFVRTCHPFVPSPHCSRRSPPRDPFIQPSAPCNCVSSLPNGSWGHSEVPWASVLTRHSSVPLASRLLHPTGPLPRIRCPGHLRLTTA